MKGRSQREREEPESTVEGDKGGKEEKSKKIE